MLPPAKVIPLLQHEDGAVRQLAVRYLAEAHDPSPATAEDFWTAIQQLAAPERTPFYHALARMPQTESSLVRTIEAIKDSKGDERGFLEQVLAKLHYGLLLRFRDLIEEAPGLPDHLQQHLEKRIELATIPPGELWERLMALGQQADDPAPDESDRLIESLARSPEFAGWAINTLNDAAIDDRREGYCVDLLGRMRHRHSVPLIVDKLGVETSVDALVRIASVDVVQRLRERFGAMREDLRGRAAEVLGRIKLPQSEAALASLLPREPDRTVRSKLADALCVIFTTDAAAMDQLATLDADVSGLFAVMGRPMPSAPKHVSRTFAAPIQDSRLDWNDDTDEEITRPPPPAEMPAAQAAPVTIRRASAKVGRNDPCPCGSGKKFKKCCGR
jgi:hypothetical protein